MRTAQIGPDLRLGKSNKRNAHEMHTDHSFDLFTTNVVHMSQGLVGKPTLQRRFKEANASKTVSSCRRSRKMLIYLFQTAGSLTTGFERQFRQKTDT